MMPHDAARYAADRARASTLGDGAAPSSSGQGAAAAGALVVLGAIFVMTLLAERALSSAGG